jgi:hypothetical protein
VTISKAIHFGILYTAMCLMVPTNARGAVFSGNPITDGWDFQGNSLTTGASYVRGSGAINFDVYSALLTVTADLLTECGLLCGAWQIGDTVLGLAAVYPADGGFQQQPGSTIPPGVIMKWGTSASAYSLSTNNSPSGNGLGSHSGSNGGLGSILARLDSTSTSGVQAPSLAHQKTAAAGDGPSILGGNYVVFNSVMNGQLFVSIEGLLNVSRLLAVNPNALAPITFGGNSIVATQRGSGNSTDALIQSFPATGEVPEPSTAVLAGGALIAAWAVRRRRSSRS